jgi:ribosomal protein L32
MEENKSPWQKFKESKEASGTIEALKNSSSDKPKNVTPLDLLNPKSKRSSDELTATRLSICKVCPELISITNQCKKCGCFMNLKTKLEDATCPLGKW